MQMSHILVVEGEPGLRELIEFYLHCGGYEVTAVQDGAAGLQAMNNRRPDLILINEQLDQMTRYQFIREVRESAGSPNTPILALVKGRTPTGAVVLAGANAVIQVPNQLESLNQTVEELLSRRPSAK
jgi:CheY-like chemotaxis protein